MFAALQLAFKSSSAAQTFKQPIIIQSKIILYLVHLLFTSIPLISKSLTIRLYLLHSSICFCFLSCSAFHFRLYSIHSSLFLSSSAFFLKLYSRHLAISKSLILCAFSSLTLPSTSILIDTRLPSHISNSSSGLVVPYLLYNSLLSSNVCMGITSFFFYIIH